MVPLRQTAGDRGEPPLPADEDARLRVLLVEDNVGDARLLQAVLAETRDTEMAVSRVTRLRDATSWLDAQAADVVLLDLGLPDSTGLATFTQLHRAHPEQAIIVLTGLEDDTVAQRAVHAGAQDYVIKGTLGARQLVRAFRHAVERHQLHQEVARLADQQKVLAGLSRTALEDVPRDVLFEQACERLCAALGVPVAVVLEHTAGGQVLIRAQQGLPEHVTGTHLPRPHPDHPGHRAGQLAPIVITDTETEGFPMPAGFEDLRSGVVVGLEGGGFDGILAIHDRSPRAWDSETVAFLSAAASVLSESIRRGRAEHDLGERIKELTTLATVARLAQRPVPPHELLPLVAHALRDGMQWPEHVVATVSVDGHVAESRCTHDGVVEHLEAPVMVSGRERGVVSVGHVQELGFLLPFEQQLIEAVAETLASWLRRTDATQALADREARLATLVATVPVGITFSDPTGRITFANDAAARILGTDPEQILNRPLDDPAWHVTTAEGEPLDVDDLPILQVLVTGRAVRQVDVHLAQPDRGDQVLAVDAAPLREPDGRLSGIVSAFVDVTEQRRAQQQLRRSEEEMRTLLAQLPGVVWTASPEGMLTSWRGAAAGTVTIPATGPPDPRELLSSESYERMRQAIETAIAGDESALELFEQDRWWRTSVRPVRDGEDVVGIVGLSLDTTDEHLAREELAGSERRFRALVQGASDAVLVIPDGGVPVYASDAIGPVLGYQPAELVGQLGIGDLAHPDDLELATDIWRRATASRGPTAPTVIRVLHRDGQVRWVEVVATDRRHDEAIGGVVVNVRDVTERDVALRAQQESEQRLRSVLSHLPGIVWVVDPDLRVVSHLGLGHEAIGIEPDSLIGAHAEDIMGPDSAGIAAARAAVASGASRLYDEESHGRWWRTNARPLQDLDGDIVGAIGLGIDITDAQEAEDALRRSEARFRRLTENAQDVIYRVVLGSELRFDYVSPAIEPMLGYTPDELYADPALAIELLHPHDRVRVTPDLAAPGVRPEPLVVRWRRRDGNYIWAEERHVTVNDDAGTPIAVEGIVRDVTDRVESEARLREALEREQEAAEHLRRLHEMKDSFLTAVSHELRTPLTSVLGFSQLLERAHDSLPPERVSNLLERLTANAGRLNALLDNLLDVDRLARGLVEPDLGRIDMAELVLRTLENVDPQGRFVTADVVPLPACVDGPKVERIIENLVVNAIRHTPAGTPIWVRCTPEDGGVLLQVEDAGEGVPEHLAPVIFEPFQLGDSPAAKVGGSGLGLSVVARFAELHGGRAWVQERDGGGASFRVWLPDRSAGCAAAGTCLPAYRDGRRAGGAPPNPCPGPDTPTTPTATG